MFSDAERAVGDGLVGSAHKPSINFPLPIVSVPPPAGASFASTIEAADTDRVGSHVRAHTQLRGARRQPSRHQTRSQTTLGPRRQSRVSRSVQSVSSRTP